MIPLKLQLKNFLSYGADLQTVDFGPYPLICLSGKNGHGKSALLDAITWAIWGCARKTGTATKADQGLLRLGQTQMMVILDFELGGTVYRVRREFMLTYGKPYAQLEFGILDPEQDTLIPLTDKTIRATQEKIEQTIRLDFDSFINSAFLRQGSANEFSKKSAKERKEILAAILGLNQYEAIRKRALEKIRTASTEKLALTTLQEKYMNELQNKSSLQLSLAKVTEELTRIEALEQKHEQEKQTLELQLQAFNDQKNQYELVKFSLTKLSDDETKQQNVLKGLVSVWRTINRKQRLASDQTALEKRKAFCIEQIAKHQQTLQRHLELKEAYLKVKEEEQQHAQRLQQQHQTIVQQKQLALERLRAQHDQAHTAETSLKKQQATLNQEYQRLQSEMEQLHRSKAAYNSELLPSVERQFERRKEYYQKYIAMGNLLTTELKNLAQKEALVHNEQDPSCPLCEQNLSASRRRFLKQQFAKTEQFITHQRSRLIGIVKRLKNILIEQHATILQLKEKHELSVAVTIKIEEYQKQREKLEHTIIEYTAQGNALAEIITQLAPQIIAQQQELAAVQEQNITFENDSSYKGIRERLKSLEAHLKATIYDATQHKQAQAELLQLEQQLHEYAHLQNDIIKQGQRQHEIANLCNELRLLKKQKELVRIQVQKYPNFTEQETTFNNAKALLEQSAKTRQSAKETVLQEKGSLETQQKKLELIELELQAQEQTMLTLDANIFDYQTIATATSKDGIQALLIEDTIPEIEQETNYLLAKLTNNQAHVFIESLRDLKKGGTKETLDINISDPAGIRPYEMFSGGEAFRIDFALRIAISKLLARRAGTALQTLIIDEGFGSQDEEGLSHIMDALYKIQDDFAKIIIVSHLPTMKDQFPVHFVVEKRPNGSMVQIVEQD